MGGHGLNLLNTRLVNIGAGLRPTEARGRRSGTGWVPGTSSPGSSPIQEDERRRAMALHTQKRPDVIWTNAGFDVERSPSGWKLGYADLVPPRYPGTA